jgi:hypothetical protein
MLGVGVEVWTISILFQFIEGQPCWSASWHVKMSFTLNEPRVKVICANLHTKSKKAPSTYQTQTALYVTNSQP